MMAESPTSSNSERDQDENIHKKRAATKKRQFTHQAIQQVKPCCIYSSAAAGIALPRINTNLPDSDDEDYHIQPIIKKGKRNVEKKTVRTRKSNRMIHLDSDDECIVGYRTPEKTRAVISLDSPCSPPPSPDHGMATHRQAMHDSQTSKVLRSINVALTNVRCIQSEVSSQSDDAFSPLARTPGGSISVIDVDEPLPNRIRISITVKVRCRSGIQRFPLQMSDTFSQVINELASHEGVTRDCVKLVKGGQDITEWDTPSAIHLHIADIIDCLIVEPGSFITETAPEQEVEVIIQGNEKKLTMTRTILRTDSLQRLMEEYSTFCGQPMDRLTFTFDGDTIIPTDTPISLDFEEDTNTIDVMYK